MIPLCEGHRERREGLNSRGNNQRRQRDGAPLAWMAGLDERRIPHHAKHERPGERRDGRRDGEENQSPSGAGVSRHRATTQKEAAASAPRTAR